MINEQQNETDFQAYKKIELIDVISYHEIAGLLDENPFDIELFVTISYCPKAKYLYTINLKEIPSHTLCIFDRFHILMIQPNDNTTPMVLVFRSVYQGLIMPSKISSLIEEETYLATHLKYVNKDIEDGDLMVKETKPLVNTIIMEPFLKFMTTNHQHIMPMYTNKYFPMRRFDNEA